MKIQQFIKDEIELSGVRALTIARLLEEYANSAGEGATLTSKREAWNVAQGLREAVK
jgi:hypothetical protein